MQLDKIISKPIVTEKSAIFEKTGKYVFKVLPNTNKIEVKKAVEKIFGTKVADVNILNTQSKSKKRGKTVGTVSGYKKAIVTLKKGEKIKIREEKKEAKKTAKKEDKKEEKAEKKAENE